ASPINATQTTDIEVASRPQAGQNQSRGAVVESKRRSSSAWAISILIGLLFALLASSSAIALLLDTAQKIEQGLYDALAIRAALNNLLFHFVTNWLIWSLIIAVCIRHWAFIRKYIGLFVGIALVFVGLVGLIVLQPDLRSMFLVSLSTPTTPPTRRPTQTSRPTPRLTSTPEPDSLPYYEDFSNPLSGWYEGESYGVTFRYGDGRYMASAPQGDYASVSIYESDYTNVVLEVETYFMSGEANSIGLVLGFRCIKNGCYYVWVQGNSAFGVTRVLGESTFELVPSQFNAAINNQTNQPNHWAIVMRGVDFTLFCNGALVAEFSDSNYRSGNIALGAFSSTDSGVEVAFDSLSVTDATTWTPPGEQQGG
ncbi:MAG: hypothetical protein MN733_04240, partial [Nitrososphaera sp.]|nr:hypothetical protein [Nitrososphaera sp.]